MNSVFSLNFPALSENAYLNYTSNIEYCGYLLPQVSRYLVRNMLDINGKKELGIGKYISNLSS